MRRHGENPSGNMGSDMPPVSASGTSPKVVATPEVLICTTTAELQVAHLVLNHAIDLQESLLARIHNPHQSASQDAAERPHRESIEGLRWLRAQIDQCLPPEADKLAAESSEPTDAATARRSS